MLVPKGKTVCIGGKTYKSGQELPVGIPAKLKEKLSKNIKPDILDDKSKNNKGNTFGKS